MKTILKTDNGKAFSITLDPGLCFAICLDMSKVLLEFLKYNKPKKLPVKGDLNDGKWSIVQSAYEINDFNNDEKIIKAQNLDVLKSIGPISSNGDIDKIVNTITSLSGIIVFGISGAKEGHELMWKRDDKNKIWLYLDPNEGLIQFDSLSEAKKYIASDIKSSYNDLTNEFDGFVLELT